MRRNGNPAADLDVELLDVSAAQTFSCSIPKSQIATSYSYQSCSFNPAVTLKQNTDYRVYLKSAGSSSGKDYRLQRINTTNSANFNSITYDGTNSVYTAFDGSWTDTSNWDIGGFYFTVQGSASYPSSGVFTSQPQNFGSSVAFNYITWTANTPAGTSINLEVSIDGETYVGPFTSPSAIPLSNINGSTIRFRANFTSDGTQTPTLNDVSINYSP